MVILSDNEGSANIQAMFQRERELRQENVRLREALESFDKLVTFLEETMSFPEYPRNIKKLTEYREMINDLKL